MTGKHPYIDSQEFSSRLDKLRSELIAQDVDAALLDEIEALTWLSGYGNSENRYRCVVVPANSKLAPFWVIRSLDAGPCRRRSYISDIHSYIDWESPFETLKRQLKERGLSRARIGLDFNSYCMPLGRFEQMKTVLPDVQWVDLGPIVWELRLIKSSVEVRLLEKASSIADQTMLRVKEVCKEGASQRDLARVAVASYVELGADPGPPGPISAGRGWDFLHAHLEDLPLKRGDVVHVELIPNVTGYSARAMRCIAVKEADSTLLRSAVLLEEIQSRQIAAMKPGANARDIDGILRGGVIEAGLREDYDNITGYTLGLYAPAGPRTSDFTRIFHPESEWELKTGMVFHMYAAAAGVSFSETVLITQDGSRRLTKLPRELFIN